MPKEEIDPIIVAYSDEDEEIDPIIVADLDEDGQKDQEEEHTREEEPPQSPPEEEKGNLPYAYTPRSPPYPPPEDDDWETESIPGLVTPDEDQDTMIVVQADQDADKDFFQDSERQSAVQQKYESEIKQAPWNPQADSDNPLMKLGDMIPKATPVYEGFWKNSDLDILSRLDVASEELKDKRSSTQKEAPEESFPHEQDKIDVEDPHPNRPESPSLLMSTQNDLSDNLEDAISHIPMEPVTPQTGPPKVIPPMPYSEHDIMVPPPLKILANFRIKLKSVAKMRTGPPPQKAKMLVDLVTQPKLIIKKLTPEEVQELSLPPAEAAKP